MDGVSSWIQRNLDPRFREFKQHQIEQVLEFQDEPDRAKLEQESEFKWGDHRDAEHDFIARFLQLHTSIDILSQF